MEHAAKLRREKLYKALDVIEQTEKGERRTALKQNILKSNSMPKGALGPPSTLPGDVTADSDFKINALFFKRLMNLLWVGSKDDPFLWLLYAIILGLSFAAAWVGALYINDLVGTLVAYGQLWLNYTDIGFDDEFPEVADALKKHLGDQVWGWNPSTQLCSSWFAENTAGLSPTFPFDLGYYCKDIWMNEIIPGQCFDPILLEVYPGQTCQGLMWSTDLIDGQYTRIGTAYWLIFWQFFIIIVVGGICQTVGELINTRLRKNISATFHRLILAEKRLYKLATPSGFADEVDNHDQRITEDLQRVLDEGVGLIFSNYIIQPSFFLLLFRSIISTELAISRIFEYERDQVNMAFLLTFAGVGILSYLCFIMTMNMISVVLYNQKRFEGNLRWSHARVINFVEPVCLYGGEYQEGAQADDRFVECYANYKYLAKLQSTLAGWNVLFRTLPYPIRYHFVAVTKVPSFQQFSLSGYISTGLTDMVQIVIQFSYFCRAGGECHRVGLLLELLQQDIAGDVAGNEEIAVKVVTDDGEAPLLVSRIDDADCQAKDEDAVIAFDRVSVSAPCTDDVILSNVTFSVQKNESICIMGPSGCGKTTIMRLMAGLWQPSQGTVRRPTRIGKGGLFFAPPRPYVTYGTLREQVMYPITQLDAGVSKKEEDFAIYKIMREVNLGWLVNQYGLDTAENWADMLSGGEMQRMGFARLFYNEPKYAIMDESLSALDEALEAKMLLMMQERDIKMISVVHRETAVNFHDRILQYDSKSQTWSIEAVGPEKQEEAMEQAHALVKTILTVADSDPELRGKTEEGKDEKKKHGCDKVLFNRIWELCVLTMPTWDCRAALFLYLSIATNILRGVVIIYQAEYSGDLVSNLFLDNLDDVFWNKVIFLYASALLSGLFSSVASYSGMRVALSMRAACMEDIHTNYFRPKVPYAVNIVDQDMDTVDQRAVGDLYMMKEFMWLCLFGGPAYTGPGLVGGMIQIVVLLAYGYTLGWFPITIMASVLFIANAFICFFGIWLAPAISARAKAEGLYRSVHTSIREYAEAIVFYGGEETEAKRADKVMDEQVTPSKVTVAYTSFPNSAFAQIIQYAYNFSLMALNASVFYYAGGAVPDALVFSKVVTFVFVLGGNLAQVAEAFKTIPFMAGYVHRVYELMESARNGSAHAEAIQEQTEITEGRVAIVDGKLMIPGQAKTLFSNLNFSVERGNSLLIMGPSGVGKSSLLRAICGLWRLEEGRLLRPEGFEHFLFVPQRPYATEGSLKQQLIYPHTECASPDELLLELLELVGLMHLYTKWGFETITTWDDKLSTGEAQRLGFVRVLYHKPTFALLDEATSALDFVLEDKLMRRCLEKGTTLISVAHRRTQIKYHRQILRIRSMNDYTLEKVEDTISTRMSS